MLSPDPSLLFWAQLTSQFAATQPELAVACIRRFFYAPLVANHHELSNVYFWPADDSGYLRKGRLGTRGVEGEESGKVRESGPSLSHLETDRVYRFTCEEV